MFLSIVSLCERVIHTSVLVHENKSKEEEEEEEVNQVLLQLWEKLIQWH